uniref:Uncharacterized protein n=1 Tax=Cucumis sativus TaxID=3659 RepID=A0A0A0K3Q5_CUCSA
MGTCYQTRVSTEIRRSVIHVASANDTSKRPRRQRQGDHIANVGMEVSPCGGVALGEWRYESAEAESGEGKRTVEIDERRGGVWMQLIMVSGSRLWVRKGEHVGKVEPDLKGF